MRDVKGVGLLLVKQVYEVLITNFHDLSIAMSLEYILVGKKDTEIILTALDTEDIGKMMTSCFQVYVEKLGGTQGGISQGPVVQY